ncbi:MAG: chemotaxis response regulator protein-glutamate methylesterase [Oligoflexia bacterium]|nr:chemotaxis response regulator protein-glutamate methylesterase [Oligoflexia bacterium]
MFSEISVLIVDDSSLLRRVAKDKISAYRGITVIGEAVDGVDAVDKVNRLKPDVVLMDCEMPVMDGIEALRIIMSRDPGQKVIMFSNQTFFGAQATIKALEIGAIDFLAKPSGGLSELDGIINRLVAKIRFAKIKKERITHKKAAKGVADFDIGSIRLPKRNIQLIGVGSSTGGVKAALEIVPHFPANSPPVVWVQHMPPSFTTSFAHRLNSSSNIDFREGIDGDRLEQGKGYLAPGGKQIRVVKNRDDEYVLKIDEKLEKISGHKPSADSLFISMSEVTKGPEVLAVILSGMGSDGAKGLKMLHDKGAYVIGQNEDSCVVYGMPRSAKLIGAVDIEADVTVIPGIINKLLGK